MPDADAYLAFRAAVTGAVRACAGRRLGTAPPALTVNGADDLEAGIRYLTVTGTSAEAGDDGETGRGNRANGLIAVGRPSTMEATAGKNPISHVGKLYNVLAQELAAELVRDIPGIGAAECVFASHVGAPIDQPVLAHLRLATAAGCALAEIEAAAQARALAALGGLTTMWRQLIAGEKRLF